MLFGLGMTLSLFGAPGPSWWWRLLAAALTALAGSADRRARLSAAGPARARELSDPARQSELLLRTVTERFRPLSVMHG